MTRYAHTSIRHLITTVLSLLILSCYLCRPSLGNRGNNNVKCYDEERKALLQFKEGIKSDYCGLLTSWKDDRDCCQWGGVQCSNDTGHVTMLRLQGSDGYECLKGNLSSSLGKLKYLTHLNLNFNYFLPTNLDFLGSLSNLEFLRIGEFIYNEETSQGQNLQWLSHLRLLRYLDLSSADLSDAKNWTHIVSQLQFLSVLRMDGCQLPTNIPASLTHLNSSPSLRVISLSNNQFDDRSLFQWLFNLPGISTRLEYLDLSSNSLIGPIPIVLGNLHHYEGAVLQGPIPKGFGNLRHLLHLDLSNNHLEGHIPNSLGNLHHLLHLDLSGNLLEGQIPSEFENMHSISYLSLSDNHLQGSVYKIFTNLCNLQNLNLGNNNFNDELTYVTGAFSSCENLPLLTLDLSQNRFWGDVPDTISSFPLLKELYLNDNHLNGKISQAIGQLSMLEKLDMSSSLLNDTLTHTHFLNLSRLRELSLSDNPRLVLNIDASWDLPFQLDIISLRSCILGPNFPNWLQTQTNFSYLDVSDAKISDNIPISFWNPLPSNLFYLNMSNNQIYGLIPILLDIAPVIELDLSSNLFEGVIPVAFTNVDSLYLNDNRFSDSSHILCPKRNSYLSTLDLSNNMLSGELPDCWMNLGELRSLHLENNRFSGSIPKSIGMLKSLQFLSLNNNSFSGPIPGSLENCTSLSILNLGYNSFNGNIPPWIGNIQNLGALILRGNNFLGEIPPSMCQLPQLQILDIGMTHISGVIPRCIYNFTAMMGDTSSSIFYSQALVYSGHKKVLARGETETLTWKREEQKFKGSGTLVKSIDFSFNELVGEIPDGVFNLTGLLSLDLSKNNLSGSISSTIGQLAALELLDLSDNHLTGKIPASLAKLNSLGILSLSNNHLSGQIPVSTQLQSFAASSYTGNTGLCGAPLSKCPGDQSPFNGLMADNNTSVHDEHDSFGVFPGLYISVVFGLITGFWAVCGTLVVKRSWRHAYFRLVQDIYDKVYVITMVLIGKAWRKP